MPVTDHVLQRLQSLVVNLEESLRGLDGVVEAVKQLQSGSSDPEVRHLVAHLGELVAAREDMLAAKRKIEDSRPPRVNDPIRPNVR